jgi:hypothetical protein
MVKYGPAYKLAMFLVFLMLNLTGCDALNHNWSQYNWFGQNTLNSIVNNYKSLPNEKALAVAYLPNGTYQTGYSWSQPSKKDAVQTAIEQCTLIVMHYGYQTKCSILYVNDEMQNEYSTAVVAQKTSPKPPLSLIRQGSTKQEVLSIQGYPDNVSKEATYEIWWDGSSISHITFRQGKVAEWFNAGDLRVALLDNITNASNTNSPKAKNKIVPHRPLVSSQYKEPSQHYAKTSPSCAENGSCYGDISDNTFRPKTTYVQGYYRKNGTYVRGHYRS